jgi:hypothetical protein
VKTLLAFNKHAPAPPPEYVASAYAFVIKLEPTGFALPSEVGKTLKLQSLKIACPFNTVVPSHLNEQYGALLDDPVCGTASSLLSIHALTNKFVESQGLAILYNGLSYFIQE